MDIPVHGESNTAHNQGSAYEKQVDNNRDAIDASSAAFTMEKLIFAQAIDFIYHNQINIIVTLLLIQLLILIALWPQVDHALLISGVCAGFIVVTWRYVLVSTYLKKKTRNRFNKTVGLSLCSQFINVWNDMGQRNVFILCAWLCNQSSVSCCHRHRVDSRITCGQLILFTELFCSIYPYFYCHHRSVYD